MRTKSAAKCVGGKKLIAFSTLRKHILHNTIPVKLTKIAFESALQI